MFCRHPQRASTAPIVERPLAPSRGHNKAHMTQNTHMHGKWKLQGTPRPTRHSYCIRRKNREHPGNPRHRSGSYTASGRESSTDESPHLPTAAQDCSSDAARRKAVYDTPRAYG